jgi:hypothetical protein
MEGVKKMMKALADSYVRKVTDGKLTHMPTSVDEALSMAKELAKSAGEAWIKKKTGLKEVDLGSWDGVKKMMKALADSYVRQVTDGKVTHMPTSLDEAVKMFTAVVKAEGEKWIMKKTGLKEVDLSVEGAKQLAKKLADSYVQKVTDGKLTHMPTSVDEAVTMFTGVLKREAEAWLKKKFGIPRIPTGLDDAMSMFKTMTDHWLNKKTGGAVPHIPKNIGEALGMLQKYIYKKANEAFKKFTGLDKLPTSPEEALEMAKQMGENALKFMTDGILDAFPKNLDEAKEMAKKLAVTVGKKALKSFAGLMGLPQNMDEVYEMIKELLPKEATIVVEVTLKASAAPNSCKLLQTKAKKFKGLDLSTSITLMKTSWVKCGTAKDTATACVPKMCCQQAGRMPELIPKCTRKKKKVGKSCCSGAASKSTEPCTATDTDTGNTTSTSSGNTTATTQVCCQQTGFKPILMNKCRKKKKKVGKACCSGAARIQSPSGCVEPSVTKLR